MRFRGTTIRRKIVALLLIPLVSLTAIWAFAATLTGRAVFGRPDIQRVVDQVGYPTNEVVSGLEQERRVAMVYVANTRDSQARIAYNKQEQTTDAAIAKLRTQIAASGIRKDLNSRAAERLDVFLNTVEGLTSLRQRIDNARITRNDTYDAYNALVDPAWGFFDEMLPLSDSTLDSQRRAVINLNRAREDLSRQDALMAAAISTGHMTATELTSFTFAVAQERNDYDDNLPVLDSGVREPYDTYWRGSEGKNLRGTQNAVVAAGAGDAPLVASQKQWQTVSAGAFDDLGRIDATATAAFYKKSRTLPRTLLAETGVTAGLGLIAVIATLIVSVRIGRSLIRDLTGLRREAQEVSGTRLPRVMRRLAAGEQVDIETEVPRLQYADDEIGQVGKALNTLQRAAVEAAVRQADMRKGVSDVFVNLARRSQVLLHRQLTLLDAMERRTEKSDELADLFRLDHMTTRMRRHAEGLVILSGAAPSRQWRKPVQLMDVVRAAVAEVEDYERVEVRRLPRLAVTGAAVADLTHLLAELIENAAVFSPPHTQVRLHGEPVANGFVLEIDDRGLGLTPDALLEANLRLAETPEFELSDTDRLGLFVVSRLAQRHGVRVSLRQSPYGGTTAVVLIPAVLLTETGDDTGSTRIEDLAESGAEETAGATEHTFRQWGMDGVGGESQKEHVAHPDEPAALPEEDPELDDPLPLPKRRPRRGAPVLVADNGRQVGPASVPREPQAPEDSAAPPTVPRQHRPEPVSPVQSVAPVQPLPPASAGRAAGPGRGESGEGSALPRRVRQANLAPQLREVPSDSGQNPEGGGSRERSADEVRDRMAALQRGWQRGRRTADAEPAPGQAPGPGPHPGTGGLPPTPVPRTTPEGNGR
ncbi:nitrate- and nitrite sensing domain-containing protein [Actinacidiphila acidipaludis]|uniref:histidine kinase n=1 Tax=Actinacidiphila acidipaludis TaxID=2873382 RepID=A0ABS7QCV6_9ACTN|nr:nitrate- and nitrite sensing domain-containing protein [Streptomyces acidipaludis]MBY8880651.1 nitrate- and nitrite sensing domain-containing protein [Streptomyces acidipaludis]